MRIPGARSHFKTGSPRKQSQMADVVSCEFLTRYQCWGFGRFALDLALSLVMAYKLAQRHGVLGPLDAGRAVNRRDLDDARGFQNKEILFPRARVAFAKMLPE